MIAFDIIFFLLWAGFNFIWNLLLPFNEIISNMIQVKVILWISSIVIIIYALLILLFYSFTKYIILHIIRSFYEKKKFDFNLLKRFYFLNSIIIVLSIIFYFIVQWFAFSYVQTNLIGFFGIIILFPFIFLFYPYMNMAQILLFDSEKDIKVSSVLKKGFSLLGKKILGYSFLYLIDIIFILIYSVFFFAVTFLLNIVIFKNNQFGSIYIAYQTVFIFLTFVFMFFIIIFNRLYFYRLVREK
ncbi:MAG: hypothetical protein V1740_06515 [Candidatus Woesearchaeota archaeon]